VPLRNYSLTHPLRLRSAIANLYDVIDDDDDDDVDLRMWLWMLMHNF